MCQNERPGRLCAQEALYTYAHSIEQTGLEIISESQRAGGVLGLVWSCDQFDPTNKLGMLDLPRLYPVTVPS
jgi:hypothetical protein